VTAGLAVIVTGAAGGLGRAMALGLVRAGARVAAVDLPQRAAQLDQLVEAAAGLGGGAVLPLQADVTDAAGCAAAVVAATRNFGALHGLVNNAAQGMQSIGPVLVGQRKRFYEVDAATWRRNMDINVNGPFNMARAVAPQLAAQGWGRIVNITTSFATMQMKGFSPYGPSKAALEAATVIWSQDLAGSGVTVNVLLPGGPADTAQIPVNEVPDRSTLIRPAVMVPPLLWLMSKDSDGVSGRRFVAQNWNAALGPAAAVAAGDRAGW
jgi:NAD(P)-dependent dehydrogenase (short-subunit alcohol dehydrogenase family)